MSNSEYFSYITKALNKTLIEIIEDRKNLNILY